MASEHNLSGSQRAAIFLLGVGEEAATEVMRHMSAKEVQQVGEAMATISKLTNNQVESVLSDFHLESAEINPLGLDATDFTRRVMTSALGQDKAQNILSQVLENPEEHNGVEALQWMAPKAIAEVLSEEHPQIAATVMTQLYDEQAAKVLELLPVELRKDVIFRIARMEELDPRAMEELDRVLESQLGKLQRTPPRRVMGPDNLAAILNATDHELEQEMLEALTSVDEELSDDVKEKMFIFDNLMQLDDRGMQRLIRDIQQESLLPALKGADGDMVERFFKNMSERAADILREDLEASGPIKLADVEVAQKEIVRTAKRLADEGELMLGKAAQDYV
jgi:flagellar motor switch protein FliG